jgi:hypothetical protein
MRYLALCAAGPVHAVCVPRLGNGCRARRARCRQIATMRMQPRSIARSPTLNSPRRAWSARNGNRVCDVAARHIGLAGCSLEGMPTTGIVPALAWVTRAFSISPQSISRTPALAQCDRTARSTSHRIAQDSHSQIAGCCVHANWCTAERRFTVRPTKYSTPRIQITTSQRPASPRANYCIELATVEKTLLA